MSECIAYAQPDHSPRRAASIARVLFATASMACAEVARAQGAAVLIGRITDSSGAPILGADVRAPQLDRGTVVDSTGGFRLAGLPTGHVTIVAEARGFAGKRVEVTIPASGTVEQSFSLMPNAHVLAGVEIRARARRQLSLQLHEFDQRQHSSRAGRFLGPDDLVKWSGRPLADPLRSIMAGARFQRNAVGELIIVSSRSLNPASIGGTSAQQRNVKPCGIQIWQDGMLLSDPNASLEVVVEPKPGQPLTYSTHKVGADRDYDISNLLTNDYAAVEYYSDLASTPPGFRTGTPSCGVLVLWTRMPSSTRKEPPGQVPDTSAPR